MLLKALPNLHSYIPVDISEQFLTEIAGNLRRDFPELSIAPVAADYTKPFKIPPITAEMRTVAYFPGSTIGNFVVLEFGKSVKLVRNLKGVASEVKQKLRTINPAYDDESARFFRLKSPICKLYT